MNQDIVLNGGARPASELAALARKATDAQLGFAIQDQLFGHDAEAEEAARVFADYYRLAARHDGEVVLDDDALAALRAQGRSATHIRKLELLVKHNTGCNALSNAQLRLQLNEYGLPFSDGYADVDRRIVLSGWADAQIKAAAYNTPQVQSQSSPIGFLLDAAHQIITAPTPEPEAAAQSDPEAISESAGDVSPSPQVPTPSDEAVNPLLSKVIDEVVAGIVLQGFWKEGPGSTAQDAQRLIKEFVWIVGDLPVDQYTQRHLVQFEKELMAMPKTVRVQQHWHRPYLEAKKHFPKLTPTNTRKAVTFNKDMAYLSRFNSRMVTEKYWVKDQMDPLALGHQVSVKQKTKAKAPWRPAHIEQMLASPIYTGNNGPKRRLKVGSEIYQDAAYWVLLIAIYSGACQGEICGLLVADVVDENCAVPHIIIRDNHLRSLKRDARERVLPIHPRLIELGLLDYLKHLKAQGATELFPELWLNAGKRGGDQYRAIVWNKLITWCRAQGLTFPVGLGGKESDFQSLRSMVLSLLDRDGINQNIVKDIAGHAREGVTAQTYQDLEASGGLDEVLHERLAVLQRLPDFAAGLKRCAPKFLPINIRSR